MDPRHALGERAVALAFACIVLAQARESSAAPTV